MDKIEKIFNEIMNDPKNIEFTKKNWKPIFMANPKSQIIIAGQAPGLKTQEKGEVFRDLSGNRLRDWLGVDEDFFYNSGKIAVLPMDFYFPGKGKSGDLPPRKDFAEKWHPHLLKEMPDVKLIILLGGFAQKYYLKDNAKKNITETVKAYKEYLPQYFPLIHPSPINNIWMKKNPEFEEKILPDFKKIVQSIIK